MTVKDQTFRMCMDCAYSVWPQHELGYCAHPDANQSLTIEFRDPLGACGPNAKLYVEKKDENN